MNKNVQRIIDKLKRETALPDHQIEQIVLEVQRKLEQEEACDGKHLPRS